MSKANEILKNNELKESLLDLMEKASKAIMEVYEKSYTEIDIKDDNTPVTKADLAANKILTDGLNNLFPEIPTVSEEESSSLNIPKTNKVFWLIDPLDGTKEFIKKNHEFTCNLALIENNASTLGFVTIPVKGLIYYGGKQFGSKLINKNKTSSEVKYKKISGICRIVASKSHLNEKTKKFINDIQGKVELIQAGSSLKFIKIAEGLADIYPRLAPTSEWDTAAAHAILEGAGGEVLQLNGKEIIYGKEDILNPYFIARGIENKVDLCRNKINNQSL
tara:strand:+ start:174 stop:1004 length:831 start_codon:yes stop_codon:yes gene_type:complete